MAERVRQYAHDVLVGLKNSIRFYPGLICYHELLKEGRISMGLDEKPYNFGEVDDILPIDDARFAEFFQLRYGFDHS